MLLTEARRAARTDADATATTVGYRAHSRAGPADTLDADDRMTHTHRLEAVRAHPLEQAGDTAAAHQVCPNSATSHYAQPGCATPRLTPNQRRA